MRDKPNIRCAKKYGLMLYLQLAVGIIPLIGQKSGTEVKMVGTELMDNDFVLAGKDLVAEILVDSLDHQSVKLAAGLFADDIERVSGKEVLIRNSIKSLSAECVLIGSINKSLIISDLIKRKIIDVSEINGQWESCLIQVVENPFKGVGRALVVAGSDRRGTGYGVMELSKQMGVSPWYYFADIPTKQSEEIYVRQGPFIQSSPSVKFRGIFINDEMWGIRPWAMHTLAPREGKGLGPTTYAKVFELLLRLKANTLWPAMHQQTRPFNYYEQNRIVADEYGIIMGSSHIEPMLRNNMAGAEWDQEYPGEPWDYVKNRDHIYDYWEERVRQNGEYENIYTLGKRGKDDEAGSDVTVEVLEDIFSDQREIIRKWVNEDVTKVPQVLIPYTEVLDLYNQGLEVPEDVIICWPDDNFGNIRQLPDKDERKRKGGSGIYYHFQWLNGATTAYPWLYTTPLALTWSEMKKAYDHNVRELWIVNVGDIKPAEVGIEHFMQMAWDIRKFEGNDPLTFLESWASRDFGPEHALEIAAIFTKHLELGYVRRPENMVMFNGRTGEITWDWFSTQNYNDEAQKRIDDYRDIIRKVDSVYESLPDDKKDAFFQMVVYNVKGAALHNLKVLYAQKSNEYGGELRASSASYTALAKEADNGIIDLIHHYNQGQITVGAKWDRMASLPGPWGGQWHQWDMPPVSTYSGEGEPAMQVSLEGGDREALPGFSVFNRDKRFIDLYNTGKGVIYWKADNLEEWIQLSETSGRIYEEKRIWVSIDWDKAPKGEKIEGSINIDWHSSMDDEWRNWENLSESDRKAFIEGSLRNYRGAESNFEIALSIFNPPVPLPGEVKGFVESNGYVSIEAEHYSRRHDIKNGGWRVISGLGRSGNSITILPTTLNSADPTGNRISNSPSLEYDVYTFTEGELIVRFNCIPSYPINKDYGLRLAVAFDNGDPEIVKADGKGNVMNNLLELQAKLNPGDKGQHILKVWMIDPGLIIDKIIIDSGGLKGSYLGPPESVFHE